MHYIAVSEKPELKNSYAFTVWTMCEERRFKVRVLSCVLTYRFACIWAALRAMPNIAEISHDFFRSISFRVFFWGHVLSNDFVLNKAILVVIREQILHIKIGRIFITWATAYVESFCRRHARKQVIPSACSSFLYRQLLKKLLVQQLNTFHILDDNAVCVLFSINLEFQKRSKPQLSRKQ